MKHTELESLYPNRYSIMATSKTTGSTTVTSGALVVGNVYFISKSGNGSTDFPGSTTNEYGDSFTADNTAATFDGAELEDVTVGKATEQLFLYGNPLSVQFKWLRGYNEDGDCAFVKVLDPSNHFIKR